MATFTHFHCGWCDDIKTCDCPCPRCSVAKQAVAAVTTTKVWQCKACGAYSDEECRPDCADVRKDIHRAEATVVKRAVDSEMKKKDCTCTDDDDGDMCDFCHWEEANCCRGCGAYPDEKCHADCRGDRPEECKGCGRVNYCVCDDHW